jgi:hypothetical protein
MKPTNEQMQHAKALRADILAAPDVWLPRREILLGWLDGFSKRASESAYDIGETEAADLTALDQFLRRRKVPAALA